VTIFPELVAAVSEWGILRRAQESGHLALRPVNLRDFACDRHRTVDDYPYGGGSGMLLKPEPLFRAVEALKNAAEQPVRVILLTPQGVPLTQNTCERLSLERHLILLCGRYKGVDERVVDALVDEEVSVGDYVLSGGELPALVLLDGLVRLLPGVLSDADSALRDSFTDGLLDAPRYTRPAEWQGRRVPDVLLSGDPKKIDAWQRREALRRTWERRPDLLQSATLSDDDLRFLDQLRNGYDQRNGDGIERNER
jgi:tRNA (guanine37-N1)-methyltransferase